MQIEIINTGSELMIGSVLNTHQQWLCRELSQRGYRVNRQIAIHDSALEIEQALKESLGRADLIITTGGLGPTSDDITREIIAQMLGLRLIEDPAVVAHIEQLFASRKRALPPKTKIQALVPEGATALINNFGTAPGLVIPLKRASPALLIMLPGPPRELRPMFLHDVLPLIQRTFPLAHDHQHRVLRTTGMGESMVEDKIASALQPLVERGLEIGYCARIGEVEVRLGAQGPAASEVINDAAKIVQNLIGKQIFAEGDETLEQVIVRLLIEKKKTLGVAESCTGGYIANRITNVPGASAIFLGGAVTYSNEAKVIFLDVDQQSLNAHGAVSEQTACQMAEGARRRLKSDFALASTGIAGPGGGTPDKPVGLVYVALASLEKTECVRFTNQYDRETFKFVTSQQALEMLRRTLISD